MRWRTPLAFLAAVAGWLASGPSPAQTPGQGIRFIVPYAAGGAPDATARIVSQRLQERLGQPVVVENRPGGNGSVAAATIMAAPPDGSTLMMTDSWMLAVNPLMFKQLAYSPQKDFTPVAMLTISPLFLAVNADLPVSTLKEFADYVRARPGKINYGSAGVGSTHHLTMVAMNAALHLEMTHIPYRGSGQSVPALLGGHVQALFSAFPALAAGIESRRVRLIAVNSLNRSPQAPEVPPIADMVPGFDLVTQMGLFARVGTPPAVVQKIATEAIATAREPEVARLIAAAGMEAAGGDPEEFARTIAAEIERVTKVIASAGIKPD
jgi:tripartite-type tricarboxylate transporter receptor subunit TctC